jgi:hypothetical protein
VTYDPHGDFTLEAKFGSEELCGNIVLTPRFETEPVDGDPLSYNDADKTFTANSVDG